MLETSLSLSTMEKRTLFRSKKIEMASPIKYVRARIDKFQNRGQICRCSNTFRTPTKNVQIGIWNASICHKEQKYFKNDIECGNCKGKGHIRRDCPNEPVCYDCLQSGHIKGSPLCPVIEQMDMNGEESEDTDDSEDSQTETADNETAGKDSSSKNKKQVTSDYKCRLRLPHKTLDSNPSFHYSSEGKKIHQLEAL